MTFAVAVVGTLLLVAVTYGVRRSWAARRRAPRRGASALAAPRCRWPSRCPRTAGRCRSASCRATCRRPGWSSTPSAGRCSTTTSAAPSRSPRAAPDDLTLVVWPENSSDIDPFRNPDAAAQIERARAAVGVPLLIGAVLAEPPGYSSNVSLFYLPGVAEPAALRQAAPGAVRRVHPGPRVLPDVHADGRPRRQLRRRPTRSASSGCPPPAGDYVALPTICFEVAYDGLMRDSVARRGRRREPARRPDQQRDVRLHRRVRAAVRHLADPRHRARPVRRARLDRGGVRVRRPRRRRSPRRPACSRPTSASRDPVVRTERTAADRLGAVPEWLAAAALLACSSSGAPALARSVRVLAPADPTPTRTEPLTETARPPLRRVAVLIPTYNERDTLPVIVRRLREVVPDVDVVVLDDNSPDGTGEVADALAADDPQVHVIHRAGKEGLGAAYLAGFAWALERGLRRRRRDGRRRLAPPRAPARRSSPRPRTRTSSSARAGCAAARSSTGRCTARRSRSAATSTSRCCSGCRSTTPPRATGSTAPTRCAPWACSDVASQGYCFQTDLTWRAVKADLTVVEVPITFVEREVGDSKMSRDIMTESLRRITGWGVRHRAGAGPRPRRRAARAEVALAVSPRRRHPVRRPPAAPRVLRWVFLALLVVPDPRDRGRSSRSAGSSVAGRPSSCSCSSRSSARGSSSARGRGPGPPCRRRCAAAGCRAASSPTPRWCSSAARCCSRPGSSPTSSGFFFILPLTRPITRAWLEAVVARRLLGPMGEWPGRAVGGAADAGPGAPAPAVERRDVIQGEVVDPEP